MIHTVQRFHDPIKAGDPWNKLRASNSNVTQGAARLVAAERKNPVSGGR